MSYNTISSLIAILIFLLKIMLITQQILQNPPDEIIYYKQLVLILHALGYFTKSLTDTVFHRKINTCHNNKNV